MAALPSKLLGAMPYVGGVAAGLLLQQWPRVRRRLKRLWGRTGNRPKSIEPELSPSTIALALALFPAARPFIDAAPSPQEGLDRFITVMLARFEQHEKREQIIAGLAGPHGWEWDETGSLTATLNPPEGVTIDFGGEYVPFRMFQTFVEKGYRLVVRDWVPASKRDKTRDFNAQHAGLHRLRAILKRQVGLTLNAQQVGKDYYYRLLHSATRRPIHIFCPIEGA